MRAALSILATVAGAAASAAGQNAVECVRSNEPYFVLSLQRHPVTGHERAYPPSVPAGFAPGAGGVPADTWAFKVFPGDVHRRAEPRRVAGFHYVARNSSATSGRNTASYLFDFALRPTLPRAGGGLDPDFGRALLQVGGAAGGGGSNTYHVYSTFSPVALAVNDCALTLRYRGGENDDKDANAGQGPSQCTASSWLDGPMPFVPDGHWHGGVLAYNQDSNYHLWLNLLEADPVCNVWSNWGRQRDLPRNPPLKGHSLGTYFSDLWRGPAPFELGFDVDAGFGHGGRHAVPLFNVGLVSRAAFPFGPATIEIDPANPGLTLLHGVPGFIGRTNPAGRLATPALTLPAPLRGARGLYLGIEYLLLDQGLAPVASTGAQWILID
jgi:hypothetical protein